MNIQEFKQQFDTLFKTEITERISQNVQLLDKHNSTVYLEHILQIASHGKRIRPYNVALTYTTYSGNNWVDITDVLLGVELLHLMCLIHDDIMDTSETRHGVPSMHHFIYREIKKTIHDDTLAQQISHSHAILIGDLIFGWAYALFARASLDQASWNVVNELVQEVVLGQMLDVHTPLEHSLANNLVERKMLLKTARYTFTRPLLLGALCAGKIADEILWLTAYGDAVGLLFQMQDDILDITGDKEIIKKEPLGDVKNKIHTLMSNYIAECASEDQKKQWYIWFGTHTDIDQTELVSFIKNLGGFQFAENYITEKKHIALQAVHSSGLDELKQMPFIALLEKVIKRVS